AGVVAGRALSVRDVGAARRGRPAAVLVDHSRRPRRNTGRRADARRSGGRDRALHSRADENTARSRGTPRRSGVPSRVTPHPGGCHRRATSYPVVMRTWILFAIAGCSSGAGAAHPSTSNAAPLSLAADERMISVPEGKFIAGSTPEERAQAYDDYEASAGNDS